MKKIIFTALCMVAGVVLCMLDSAIHGLFFSLSLVVCLSLFYGTPYVAVCTIFGMVLDFFNYSLPFFTFIYLYISVGCVWIKGFLFKKNSFVSLSFWLGSLTFTCLVSGSFTLFNCVLSTLSFFVFYGILKGVNFEKNNKI